MAYQENLYAPSETTARDGAGSNGPEATLRALPGAVGWWSEFLRFLLKNGLIGVIGGKWI